MRFDTFELIRRMAFCAEEFRPGIAFRKNFLDREASRIWSPGIGVSLFLAGLFAFGVASGSSSLVLHATF
jgi:hypothetical protein